jgi:hypothetical protein
LDDDDIGIDQLLIIEDLNEVVHESAEEITFAELEDTDGTQGTVKELTREFGHRDSFVNRLYMRTVFIINLIIPRDECVVKGH